MKLIIGLGNPGEKYARTRHNVGFMCVDYVQSRVEGREWTMERKMQTLLSKAKIGENEIIVAKPQTFMNESGRSVSKILSVVNCQLSDVYVVHDDLDIQLGEYKVQRGKGPKIHNGIASVEKHLKTTDFNRVRIGVDNRDTEYRIAGEKYVLLNFLRDEREVVMDVFKKVFKELV